MNVLVTGGAGFIGAHLVRDLLSSGDNVIVLDNLHRGSRTYLETDEKNGAVQFVEGDIRDRAAVFNAARGVERIYHLAAQSNVLNAVADIDYSFSTNVVGTFNVLLAARDTGVERVIFTSSREVYGEVGQLPVAESRPAQPKNAYGAGKAAGEAYCQAFAGTYGMQVRVLRLANAYGPGDRDRVIPIWLACAAAGQSLELYGGDQIIDFVPITLVVRALRAVADTGPIAGPINIGSGTGTTLKSLVQRIQALPGVDVDSRVLPARSVEVTRFVADVTCMRDVLGLEPPDDPLQMLPALWDAVRR